MTAELDTVQAERYLRALGGRFTFQTFDDHGKDRRLSSVLHGTLAEQMDTLTSLNARGAGVFVMVNEGNGKGRGNRNVQRIRAYFADFDGAQPPSVATVPLRPHCIIESSPSRWHWYWWIQGAPLDTFKAVQVALAERYGSDARVNDLCRVMRLPGFVHCKGEPFRTRIIELRDAPRYSHAEFVRAFGIDLSAPIRHKADAGHANVTWLPSARKRQTLPGVIPEGERNAALLSLAAGLVRKGYGLQTVTGRMQRINAERCQPQLGADEVDGIAARAFTYGSKGYRFLSDTLFDELTRSGLPLPVRWMVLTVLRRFNKSNADNIALTQEDCRDIPGCRNERRFLRYRRQAVAAGFLVVAKQPQLTRDGKKPTLYAIPPRFLPSLASHNGQYAHTRRNV